MIRSARSFPDGSFARADESSTVARCGKPEPPSTVDHENLGLGRGLRLKKQRRSDATMRSPTCTAQDPI